MAKPTKLQKAQLKVKSLDDELMRLHEEQKTIQGRIRDIKAVRELAVNAWIVEAVRKKYENPADFLEDVSLVEEFESNSKEVPAKKEELEASNEKESEKV